MFGDLGGLMKQAQKMQKEMARVQQELASRVVEGTAGGGKVTAYANGRQELVSIKIDPEVLSPDDAEIVQEMVAAAVNQALDLSRKMTQEEMAKVTGGLKLPGMM